MQEGAWGGGRCGRSVKLLPWSWPEGAFPACLLAMAMAVKLPRTSAADKVQRSPSAEAQGIRMTFIPHVDSFDDNHPTWDPTPLIQYQLSARDSTKFQMSCTSNDLG